MQRVIMTAAAMLLGAGVAVSTAKADMYVGPLVDQAKGLCYKTTGGDLGFGYWTECAKPAAVPAGHHHPAKHNAKNAEAQ